MTIHCKLQRAKVNYKCTVVEHLTHYFTTDSSNTALALAERKWQKSKLQVQFIFLQIFITIAAGNLY